MRNLLPAAVLLLSACVPGSTITVLYFARCTETNPKGTPDVRDTEHRATSLEASNDATAYVTAHPEYACTIERYYLPLPKAAK